MLEPEADMAVCAADPGSRIGDDDDIITASMHQPVMAFADDHLAWKPASHDAEIFKISVDDLSDTIASCSETDICMRLEVGTGTRR